MKADSYILWNIEYPLDACKYSKYPDGTAIKRRRKFTQPSPYRNGAFTTGYAKLIEPSRVLALSDLSKKAMKDIRRIVREELKRERERWSEL